MYMYTYCVDSNKKEVKIKYTIITSIEYKTLKYNNYDNKKNKTLTFVRLAYSRYNIKS